MLLLLLLLLLPSFLPLFRFSPLPVASHHLVLCTRVPPFFVQPVAGNPFFLCPAVPCWQVEAVADDIYSAVAAKLSHGETHIVGGR